MSDCLEQSHTDNKKDYIWLLKVAASALATKEKPYTLKILFIWITQLNIKQLCLSQATLLLHWNIFSCICHCSSIAALTNKGELFFKQRSVKEVYQLQVSKQSLVCILKHQAHDAKTFDWTLSMHLKWRNPQIWLAYSDDDNTIAVKIFILLDQLCILPL